MTWFKVDDSFYDHPKTFDAPDCAVALWARAGAWSARNLTDGFVPSKLPARLCDDPDTAIRELIGRGLWTKARGGYLFHEWTDYQPSKAEVKQLREKRVEAGRRGGHAKADKQTPSNGLASARASATQFAKQNSAPARPVPSFTYGYLGKGGSPGQRAREREPPPARCPAHASTANPPKCGQCKDARIAYDQWQQSTADLRKHCRLCNQDGWRRVPNTGRMIDPPVKCDHQPDQEKAP